MVKKLLFTLFLVLVQAVVFSQKTYSGASGGWNVATNWTPNGVPTSTDDVIIPSGKTVTINADAVAKNISVSGVLSINNDILLTVSGDVMVTSGGSFDMLNENGSGSIATLVVYGNYNNNGSTNFWKGDVLIVGNLTSTSTSTIQNNGNVIVGGNITGDFDSTGSGNNAIYVVNPNANIDFTPPGDFVEGVNVVAGTSVTTPNETQYLVDLVNQVIYGGSCPFIGTTANISACSGTNAVFTITFSTPTPTGAPSAYQWQFNKNDGSGWNSISGATNATFTLSNVSATMDKYKYRAQITWNGCVKYGNYGILTVNTAPSQPTLSTSIQPTCTTSTGSFTIANYNASYTYAASPSTGVVISGNTVTAPTGSYTLTATQGTCTSVASSSITINAQPATPVKPTLSIATQPTCSTSTGSFTITNYNASYTYAASPSVGVVISGNTVTAPTGSYTLTATQGTCTSVVSSGVTINNQAINTWNGSVWSTGSAPTSSEKIIFDGLYSSATNINACSCQVNSGKSVTILSGGTLKITNEVTVLGSGTLTFENNSSLVQINDAAINTGSITYRRQTNSISKFDYTYWSSPVSPQTLYNVSPNTLYDKFFSYNAVSDVWTPENSGNNMVKGIGYIIRGPENYVAPTPPGLYEANFKGVPNNGTIPIPIGGLDSSNLIGNPYPSALDADKFLTDNSSVLDGTLYFWTHSTAIANNVYSSNDYASYNLTGGVGTDGVTYLQGGTVAPNGGQKPSGKIGSGQGFFATGKASGTATFNNSMRVGVGSITGDNSQFFKMTNSKTTSLIEKHRVWLNLTNSEGAFKQTLLGYVTNATNGYDNSYDGESFDGNQFIDFYSVNEDKNLTIQGRALPFDENDVVSLGFSSTIEGDFSIGIDEVDGLFTSQDVFIEDKNTNSIKNLKDGPYTFTTESGTFNDRFVLRYINANKTLDTGSFEILENTVLVSNKNKLIKIDSPVVTINKVQVYDLLGRSIYQKLNVDVNELTISNIVINNQVLLVKILLQNGKTITKKIIY